MKGKVFWGIFFILMAAYIIVAQMGVWTPQIGVWPTIITVICFAFLVHGISECDFFGILFPIAVICIIYRQQLHLQQVHAGSMILVAVFSAIGLELIFGKVKKRRRLEKVNRRLNGTDKHFTKSNEKIESSEFDVESKFGSEVRYVRADDFRYATIDTKFSGIKLYLQEAKIPQGNATIELNIQFSGLEIYVPSSWQIINHVDTSFGAVEEKGMRDPNSVATLTLQGSGAFCGVTIRYV